MSSAYLSLAEQVLEDAAEPLTPAQIMERAFLLGVVPWHLHGKTQQKTLHARLSEDVAKFRERSRFYRTAPGVFYLNKLRSSSSSIPPEQVHLAPPRRKDLLRGMALCVPAEAVQAIASADGRIEAEEFRRLLDVGHYRYQPKGDARLNRGDLLPVSSFVIVHVASQILSFRTGKYVRLDDDVPTPRSIGFGDVVSEDDNDLLYDSLFGIRENAIQDLIYGIGLEQELAREVRYRALMPAHFALLQRSGTNYEINIVLSYEYASRQPIQSRSLSFGDLRWISADAKLNNLTEYDSASQAILEHGWMSEIVAQQP